jgi:hypothetical protein
LLVRVCDKFEPTEDCLEANDVVAEFDSVILFTAAVVPETFSFEFVLVFSVLGKFVKPPM